MKVYAETAEQGRQPRLPRSGRRIQKAVATIQMKLKTIDQPAWVKDRAMYCAPRSVGTKEGFVGVLDNFGTVTVSVHLPSGTRCECGISRCGPGPKPSIPDSTPRRIALPPIASTASDVFSLRLLRIFPCHRLVRGT